MTLAQIILIPILLGTIFVVALIAIDLGREFLRQTKGGE